MNYNKLLLGGHLCGDPELNYTAGGTAITTFSVAVNYTWHNAEKEKKEEVTFVNCKCFSGLGETITAHFTKGMPIFLEGRLVQESWDGKDGKKQYAMKMYVEKFQFCGGNKPKERDAGQEG